jgi:hypothetical protein
VFSASRRRREGDVFDPAVNLAGRLVNVARLRSMLMDAAPTTKPSADEPVLHLSGRRTHDSPL